ncbi:MAG: hypothetical protein KDC84_03365 [Crocinitomicaceae bacterium]|nr:hypothetical protein [Crocinitomicaceae bacterium]
MGKVIYYTRLILLLWLLFSCGTNNFAKRRYMKGVYVEKRSVASSRKMKAEHQTKNSEVAKKFTDEKEENKSNLNLTIIEIEQDPEEIQRQYERFEKNDNLQKDQESNKSHVPINKTTFQAYSVPVSSPAPSYYPAPLFIWSTILSLFGWAMVLVDIFVSLEGLLALFLGLPIGVAALVMSIISVVRAFAWDYGTFGKVMAIISLVLAVSLTIISIIVFIGLI